MSDDDTPEICTALDAKKKTEERTHTNKRLLSTHFRSFHTRGIPQNGFVADKRLEHKRPAVALRVSAIAGSGDKRSKLLVGDFVFVEIERCQNDASVGSQVRWKVKRKQKKKSGETTPTPNSSERTLLALHGPLHTASGRRPSRSGSACRWEGSAPSAIVRKRQR